MRRLDNPCRLFLVALLALCSPLAAAGETQAPSLLLANPYRDGIDLARYWVSEKLDGVRARWDGETLVSRGGNRFNAPVWFTKGFPRVPLDGELWMGRGTFERLSGAVRRQTPDEAEWRTIRFMVFDLPASPAPFDERLQRLRVMFETMESPRIALVEQFRVADHDALMEALNRVVDGGGEGLMLHRGSSLYTAGRTGDLLKVKRYDDAEAVVVRHLPGKGRLAGMLGALLVEMPDGRRFRLGTGFSDEERRKPPPPGTTVTYRYLGKTRTGLPRFASFLRIRNEMQARTRGRHRLRTARPPASAGEPFQQPRERLPAVADRVLLRARELGRGPAELIDEEHGIVAEAAGASRVVEDPSSPDPLAHDRARVVRMAEVDDCADERRPAVRRIDVRERLEQPGDVVRIARAGAAIACRADTGGAAQRIDDDPRVVGERRQPGRRARGARLDERILHEREAGLFRLLDPICILRDDVQPGGLQQRAQLVELARVRAGEHDLHDGIVCVPASGRGRGVHRSVRSAPDGAADGTRRAGPNRRRRNRLGG